MGLMGLIGLVCLVGLPAHAQIKIGGNVYGGGNVGKVNGNTTVQVKAGDLNRVYGGARMADVGGSSYVNIDGENATDYMVINYVYGGNDIAGTIGTREAESAGEKTLPAEIASNEDVTSGDVDISWNTFVHLSAKMDASDPSKVASDNKKVYIGQLFAGGNGEYYYEQSDPVGGKTTHSIYADEEKTELLETLVTDAGDVGFQLPEVDKAYLDIQGGSIVYAYGGGNNATVRENTVIHVKNPSTVVNHILVDAAGTEATDATYATYETNLANGTYKPDEPFEISGTTYRNLLTNDRFKNGMGINTTFSKPSSDEFQIGRFFGGNNRADMAIQPLWNLQSGSVRNIYSGGNKGRMTHSNGLLLEIAEGSTIKVDNLFGGCRMADVRPKTTDWDSAMDNPVTGTQGDYKDASEVFGTIGSYKFPDNLAARVVVAGGDVNNVYGGNDVTGKVYFGSAVGIEASIRGNVYGGGNGAYPYTNQDYFRSDQNYVDFFYSTEGDNSEALKDYRPNGEQVSILVRGKDAEHPTVVGGAIFLGGNCATLKKDPLHTSIYKQNGEPLVELKMGSHVYANEVYLGNNGEDMVSDDILKQYAYEEGDYSYNSLNLKGNATHFANYMDGVAMDIIPTLTYEDKDKGDRYDYDPYTSYIGSLFLGGNRGSVTYEGTNTMDFSAPIYIFNKVVGGCNNANVKAGDYNAAYEGGILGYKDQSKDEQTSYKDDDGNIRDRLVMNFNGLRIKPMRWKDESDKTKLLEWNTNKWKNGYVAVGNGTTLTKGETYYTSNSGEGEFTATGSETATGANYYEYIDFEPVANSAVDDETRLLGGNVYGGCYESGHVNGNVVIDINDNLLDKSEVFGSGNSLVELENQRDDLMSVAMSVFGAGKGEDTEIWGSTNVNLNSGYAFQVFGGGEEGMVGKPGDGTGDAYDFNDKKYYYNPAYSSTVNLNGTTPVYSSDEAVSGLAETEYIYGGGNEGEICGNTLVNLGNGRIYDAFGGASDADILGHSEVYIGRQPNGSGDYDDGLPWIKDIVYGGNDFGGTIYGTYEAGYDFEARLRNYDTDKTQLHGYKDGEIPDVLKSSTYVEYLAGRVDTIFGGGYGYYDYSNTALYGTEAKMPRQNSSFVNIRPRDNENNIIKGVFGGGTGYPGNREGDKAQNRSYVLIDIPDDVTQFSNMEAFGGGSYNGLGMAFTKDETLAVDTDGKPTFDLDRASAVIDLLRGRIHNAYGGSYQEGVTRRTVVNVPAESSIQIDSIYGGAYGRYILPPCDVYETQVNYKNTSEKAQVFGAIFGGNNNERRSLFTQVNISSPVWSNKVKKYTGTVYGAGRGIDTWAEHTEVNLLSGARVYEVYGGGEMGHVLNTESVQAYMELYKDHPSPQIGAQDAYWNDNSKWNLDGSGNRVDLNSSYEDRWKSDWLDAWTIDGYYNPGGTWTDYVGNAATNLSQFTDRAELDDKTAAQLSGLKKFNTNVIVNEGAVVEGYVYGGGLGKADVHLSGDVYGNTYAAVLGGEVKKDVYAGGRAGGLNNLFGAKDPLNPEKNFVATANAYIRGGTARNVYGGGYLGHVGAHTGDIHESNEGDVPAVANVVIGKADGTSYLDGIPAITRNAYGGGEGGSVYGTSNLTLNNGYIGYRYKNLGTESEPDYQYVEELDDQQPGDIEMSGNVFGGGYVVNSYVDIANVNMYGGTVRGSLYGGGEVGPIGRGTIRYKNTHTTTGVVNGNARIYKAGQTHVNMYNGWVKRNVFGGGRGKDSWGGDGTMYMKRDMTQEAFDALDLQCKGYVFGQTEVNIHGGEIGTSEGIAQGYGNVFGGGDEGSVYSAYEKNGSLYIGKQAGERYDGDYKTGEGRYYEYDGTSYLATGGEYSLTEDCKVVVEPWLQVKNSSITYPSSGSDSKTYAVGDYVPTAYLNTLGAKGSAWPSDWDYVDVGTSTDERGIVIHNAVFAGGNIAAGSSTMYANETTVYGNVSASIHDVYNRDFITLGTGDIGGLYGDGNLTFVDGYRELNITNYGTDYYHLTKQLPIEEYRQLPEREKAYYEPKYRCKVSCTDDNGTTYTPGSTLPMDELIALFTDKDGNSLQQDGKDIVTTEGGKRVPSSDFWTEEGVVSTYAGRLMNTIQRADLCGVFGSRMVMKGAEDRVPEIVDNTNYTINRVREVSLNKKVSPAGDTDADNKEHGNYFGIYSNVNYLGALSSDVKMTDVRQTKADLTINPELKPSSTTETFEEWKKANVTERTRNNGTSHNMLALASGVYLELTSEKSTGKTLDKKDWGLVTGVIELDLINVQPGIGGGFVYAKNQHGVRTESGLTHTTLTALNKGATTQRDYTYDTTDAAYNSETGKGRQKWETSGNFIHSSQTIIDDCYNISNRYIGDGTTAVPAHYWYIAGQVYVYDQYISAYTGSPNAYSETVEIPVTITAASHGTMTLMDIQPNLYAYYSSYTSNTDNTPLSGDNKLVINDVSYKLNDPITYWEWNKLSAAGKKLFVPDTYVATASCKVGDTEYPIGTVLLKSEYDALKDAVVENKTKTLLQKKLVGEAETYVTPDEDFTFDYVFRSSNNISHDKGYILTYDVTNPKVWDQWYTQVSSSTREKNQTGGSDYEDGPTYHPTANGLYGQHEYENSDIISETVHNTYTEAWSKLTDSEKTAIQGTHRQATFGPAYVVTSECESGGVHYYPGAPVSVEISGSTSPAYVCTSTIQLSATEYIYVNQLMTATEKATYYDRFKDGTDAEKAIAADIDKLIVPAYICTSPVDPEGKPYYYGGDYYEADKNYRALSAYSAMSEEDRKKFVFNYDALDVLVDPEFSRSQGQKYQYDGKDFTTRDQALTNAATYSLKTPIDYTATYNGTTDATAHNGIIRTNGQEYTRVQYESLPNEQRHYTPVKVTAAGTYYVVNTDFVHIETPYAVGTVISEDQFKSLSGSEQAYITQLEFTASDFTGEGTTYYFCRERYQVGEKTEGVKPTPVAISGATTGGIETIEGKDWVKVGTIIKETTTGSGEDEVIGYTSLPNYQKDFTIHGKSPMETSTFYVSRNSDIKDLSKEKIITVIYKYDYEETDKTGHITPVSERHVVNIHITFESGVPTVEDIQQPGIVLPGTGVVMRVPNVTPGAYEVLGGGWELFEKESNAESHTNGVPYSLNVDSLYWYQDGFLLAYYAKTYLGKTYSNYVPVSVANYHDLKSVMDDKAHHLNVDYDRTRLKRDAKVYINDYSGDKDGLDYLRDFYDLSVLSSPTVDDKTGLITTGSFEGHKPLNNSTDTGTNIHDGKTYTKGVKGGTNLDFFLRTDIDHTVPSGSPAWTPIANNEGECFNGTLHGDGHTITGLTSSLIGHLCGNVYNLGVTGSFTGGGIADTGEGYVESCWVKTSGTPADGVKAVFGDPTATSYEQTVNCYYHKDNAYTEGDATPMPDRAFNDGTLAYDLNNFYLYKRYCDQASDSEFGADPVQYNYWLPDNSELQFGKYANNEALCSSGYNQIQYVEERFLDGDFRYAAGEIPSSEDERYYVDTEDDDKEYWFPIWPDDYLFFGQKLTYGHVDRQTHEDKPSAVRRTGGRIDRTESGNRVYRAPAYFRSKDMDVAHFNAYAVFAQTKKDDPATIAYKDMTAIDFTGHNDKTWAKGSVSDGFPAGKPAFYPPLLDDDGITGFRNVDLTRNLLAYTAEPGIGTAAGITATTIASKLPDPAYSETNTDYRTVARQDASSIYGHRVEQTGDDSYTAQTDHLLVDRQDFNAPIPYTFASGKRMWYQRRPDTYVDLTKGWEGVSLPFTAELVTTHEKGEITHFYSGSDNSDNNTKLGHEYWLRRFTSGGTEKTIDGKKVYEASLVYPESTVTDADKTVTNTFLWDYYYKGLGHSQKDLNSDTYQTYYEKKREYDRYARLTTATPYIIGFPGGMYYEFDLSGEFQATTTATTNPVKLGAQTITFASETGATIAVSDDEVEAGQVKDNNNYVFQPSYLSQTFPAGTANTYTLAADGASYDFIPTSGDPVTVEPFRPYFTKVSGGAPAPRIVFSRTTGNPGGDPKDEDDIRLFGYLDIRGHDGNIIVTSHLTGDTTVRIVDAAGALINSFDLQPDQTVTTRVAPGVYLVNKKKIAVR